jgi:deoxyribodipyrimidine photo-lyase
MLPPVHIVWFKRDLRVDDHAPLCHAVAQGRVIPIYIVEPEYWALPDVSRRHWHFIHDSLGDLERALGSMGASLVIHTGDAVAVLEAIRATYGHVSLWSHEETGNGWTYARDRKVAAWCRSHGIKWGETPSNGIVRRLKSRDGWAALRDARMAQPILAAPPAIQPVEGVKSEPLPPKGSPVFGSTRIGNVQTGGARGGITNPWNISGRPQRPLHEDHLKAWQLGTPLLTAECPSGLRHPIGTRGRAGHTGTHGRAGRYRQR